MRTLNLQESFRTVYGGVTSFLGVLIFQGLFYIVLTDEPRSEEIWLALGATIAVAGLLLLRTPGGKRFLFAQTLAFLLIQVATSRGEDYARSLGGVLPSGEDATNWIAAGVSALILLSTFTGVLRAFVVERDDEVRAQRQ